MVRLGELLGAPVRTEDGESLGRLFDLRAELGKHSLRVTGIVVGKGGFLERLGLGAPTAGKRIRTHDMIPWSSVVRADRRGIVVSDDTKEL